MTFHWQAWAFVMLIKLLGLQALTTPDPFQKDVKVEDVYFSKACWDRAAAYLDLNDFIPSWVSEHYRTIQTECIKTFVSIKDLYAHFKKSDHFQTLSKREQRNQNEGKFRKAIAKCILSRYSKGGVLCREYISAFQGSPSSPSPLP